MVKDNHTILIADDDEQICKFLEDKLGKEGFETECVQTLSDCIEISNEKRFDVIFLDIMFPEGNSMEILPLILAGRSDLHVIMLTATNSVAYAVEAMKLGAYDYIQKPFKFERLMTSLNHALDQIKATREIKRLQQNIESSYKFENIVGESKVMRDLFDLIEQLSGLLVTVLLQAESGTGKELVAKAIHFNGERSKKPFVVVNCAAIPENLIESELFGHEKGAFTGASTSRAGKFEKADGGTIFLDEIGEMPLAAQTRLLRVLQEQEFERVGSDNLITVDVRVIIATNKNLKELVDQKLFREDLYYRISVFPVRIPPLRERKEDIPTLSAHFVNKYKSESKVTISGIEPKAVNALTNYDWPGNVRELENTIHRAVIICQSDFIRTNDLPPEISRGLTSYTSPEQSTDDIIEIKRIDDVEKDAIRNTLNALNGDMSEAAKALGIGRATLYRKVKKYEIE